MSLRLCHLQFTNDLIQCPPILLFFQIEFHISRLSKFAYLASPHLFPPPPPLLCLLCPFLLLSPRSSHQAGEHQSFCILQHLAASKKNCQNQPVICEAKSHQVECLKRFSVFIRGNAYLPRTAEKDNKEHWQSHSEDVHYPKPGTLFSCCHHLAHNTRLEDKVNH